VLVLLPRLFPGNIEPLSKDLVFKAEVNKFIQSVKNKSNSESINSGTRYVNDYSSGKEKRYRPFKFDPNTTTLNEWVEMGFSNRQAESILKYRNKGGNFNKKEDFRKLYIIDDETYRIFEPYISISKGSEKSYREVNESSTNVEYTYKNERVISKRESVIEINGADSVELLKIRGVGPVFASRIIKYRTKLGGFYSVDQLTEIYGMDSVRLAGIYDQIAIDTIKIKKIQINKSNLADLRKHPYMDYYTAKALIDKRIQTGSFTDYRLIKSILDRKKGLFFKLKPYISLN
jgi:competence ComEA-like helix-hairpin-helix protein